MTTQSWVEQGPCPECDRPALITRTLIPVDELGSLPPRTTGVACSNDQCDKYVPPPRRL